MRTRLFAAFVALLVLPVLELAAGSPARAAGSGQVLAAVKAVAAETDKLRSMMADLNESQFQLVDASGASTPEVDAALKKNAAAVADLRDALSHTTLTGSDGVVTSFSRLLQAKQLKISQVIAIAISGGVVTVYYQ